MNELTNLTNVLNMSNADAKNFAETLYNIANSDINLVDEKLIDQSAELLDTFTLLTGIEF